MNRENLTDTEVIASVTTSSAFTTDGLIQKVEEYILDFKEPDGTRHVQTVYKSCPEKSFEQCCAAFVARLGSGTVSSEAHKIINLLARSALTFVSFFLPLGNESALVRKYWGAVYLMSQVGGSAAFLNSFQHSHFLRWYHRVKPLNLITSRIYLRREQSISTANKY